MKKDKWLIFGMFVWVYILMGLAGEAELWLPQFMGLPLFIFILAVPVCAMRRSITLYTVLYNQEAKSFDLLSLLGWGAFFFGYGIGGGHMTAATIGSLGLIIGFVGWLRLRKDKVHGRERFMFNFCMGMTCPLMLVLIGMAAKDLQGKSKGR